MVTLVFGNTSVSAVVAQYTILKLVYLKDFVTSSFGAYVASRPIYECSFFHESLKYCPSPWNLVRSCIIDINDTHMLRYCVFMIDDYDFVTGCT